MPGNVTSPGVTAQASGAQALASNALPIGTRIHEFEITRVIGEGGFSVVYLAFDHTLHRSIALKEYIPSALASRRGDQTVAVRSAQHQQTFEAGLRSFINESRLLAQFDHPALVKVYRFWEANGTAYMAMPHYEGRTLKEILREHPEQASQAWLKRLLVPLLDALALLHLHHCYHRDIAPDNIQILENGEPVLLDFGAARRTIGDMTQAFTVILKPGYAPIEQYAEETDLKQGPWTDVYALSAVLHGAIVGKPPPTAVARVIKDPLEPLATRGIAGFDPRFLGGIDRGLAVRPEARPQSIAEWRSLLGMDGRPAAVRDVASDASRTRLADAPADDRTRSGQGIDAEGVATIDDPEEEADRTVLVPGLRRSPPLPRSATPQPAKAANAANAAKAAIATPKDVASPPSPRDARPALEDAAKPMPWRPIALVAGIVVVAVVAWLVIARPFELASAPVVAKTGAVTTPAPPAGTPANPPQSSPSTPAPQSSPLPQTPALQSSPPAPRTQSAPPAQPQSTEPPPAPPAPAQALSAQEPSPLPAAASASEQPPSAAPETEAVPRPKPPAIPEDERRWTALRNTDNIDDLRTFRRRFPQSRYAQEAAVRIQQLMRQSRENARETAPAAKPAAAATPPVAKSAQPQERPRTEAAAGAAAAGAAAAGAAAASSASNVAGASTGTVHIRVQPFGYVYVDGALVGPSPPSRELQLSPGRHHIEARNDQENPPVIRKEVDVTAAGSTEVPLRFRE